jgi:signal transduction histidine kinase
LAQILNNRDNDSITRTYYFELSESFYNLGENKSYVETCRKILAMSQKANDTLALAKSLYYIGDYHFGKFQNDSAYYYYIKAEKTYSTKKNNVDISRLKFNKANILFFEKDFLGCETAVIGILKVAKQKKDTRLIYDCYVTLGNALDGLNDSKNALEYYNKALAITNELKEDSQYLILKAQAYNYIGLAYQKQTKYEVAASYFKKAIAFGDLKNTIPFLYASIINNLAYSNLKLEKMSSLSQFKEALEININISSTQGIVTSKLNLSEYYLTQKDTTKAIRYSAEALQKAHENRIYEDELKSLELLAKIDPKKTVVYNKRFIKLTDSLQNNERAIRNKFARIEFETDEILVEKKNIETEKEKISYQRWVILGFSALTLIVMGLLYVARMQRAKNKELQLEQEKQKANEEIYSLMLDQQTRINAGRDTEKKRISQELHDGVMSKLTSTRLNLFILSKRTDEDTIKKCLEHIANIQNIEKEIRGISHDLAKDIFATKDSFKMIMEGLFEEQNELSTTTHFTLEINESIQWDAIPSTIKMNLYRIFQESIQNVNKYAKAKEVIASITQFENEIHVDISDNGVGFDTTKTKEGIGLKNMKTRMKSVNGVLEVESVINKGTHINLIIPI